MKKIILTIAALAVCAGAANATKVDFYQVYAGWNCISAPVVPINPDPLSVFEGLNVNALQLFDATIQSGIAYDEYSPEGFGNVLLGDGYWYNGDAEGTVSYEGLEDGVPTGTVKTDMWLSLPGNQMDGIDAGGWQLIGTPFNHDVPASTATGFGDNIVFTDGTSVKTWSEAADAGWVASAMMGFDPLAQSGFSVGYDFCDDDSMRAGKGYWIQTYKDNLAVIIPGN